MVNACKAKVDSLWETYTSTKSIDCRNELVLEYLFLVKSIVYRLLPIYKGYSNYDDLLSYGILGLIDAIDKYTLKREVRFEYYASMRIKGEIIDHMRKQDWAPSSLRRKIQVISNAYSELEKTYARTPTDSEVAKYVDMDEDKLHKVLEKAHMFNVLHFEEMLSEEYTLEYAVQDKSESLEDKLVNKELKQILGEMIDALPEKEKLVMTLYYYEELTLKEIAGVLGVSESRVSQIHSKVILKLRTKMRHIFVN